MKTHTLSSVRGLVLPAMLVWGFSLDGYGQLMRGDLSAADYKMFAQDPGGPLFALAQSVGAVHINGGQYVAGNATYLGNGYFLTSAHVLSYGANITSVGIGMGLSWTSPSRVLTIDSWKVHPSFSGGVGSPFDVAVLHSPDTTSLLGVPAVRIYDGPELGAATRWYAVGFGPCGYPGTGVWTDNGDLRGFENVVNFVDINDNLMSKMNRLNDSRLLPLHAIGLPGWSGSGNFVWNGSFLELNAISSFVTDITSPDYGDYQGSLKLSGVRAFIAQAVPEPACTTLLGFGALLLCGNQALRRKRVSSWSAS